MNIEDEEEEVWLSGSMECYLCSKEWVAVFHVESEELECPRCGNMVSAEDIIQE